MIVKKAGTGENDVSRAIIYRSTDRKTAWDMYQDDEPWFEMQNIPEAPGKWSADTNHFATFLWDLDDPEKQIQRGQLIDGWEEFQDDDKDDAERFVEQIGNCVIPECGSPIADDHVFCAGHRGKGLDWVTNELDEMVDIAALGRQPRERVLKAEKAFGGSDELPALPGDGDDESDENTHTKAAAQSLGNVGKAVSEVADGTDDDENIYDVFARETGLEREEIEEAVVEQLQEQNDERDD
jgi:hypothetical protein